MNMWISFVAAFDEEDFRRFVQALFDAGMSFYVSSLGDFSTSDQLPLEKFITLIDLKKNNEFIASLNNTFFTFSICGDYYCDITFKNIFPRDEKHTLPFFINLMLDLVTGHKIFNMQASIKN